MKKLKLKEILEGIEDNRRKNSVMYPLYEVLFIMIKLILSIILDTFFTNDFKQQYLHIHSIVFS